MSNNVQTHPTNSLESIENYPYFYGTILNFSWENSKEFKITDEYSSLSQLYRVHDFYKTFKPTSKVEYSRKYNFWIFYCGLNMELNKELWKTYSSKQGQEFLEGVVDMNAKIEVVNHRLELSLFSTNKLFLEELLEWIQIPGSILEILENENNNYVLTFYGTNAIDFMGKVPNSYKQSTLNLFIQGLSVLPKCRVFKRDPGAVLPSKSRLSDVGYDTSIIRVYKKLNEHTTLYDTGIALEIPLNYYVELVPRSSLSKSGYMLSNSIGIIDASYQGNLYIALTKVSPDAIELENQFPFRCCQIVFKRQQFVELEHWETEEGVYTTTRNNGGFGSTG